MASGRYRFERFCLDMHDRQLTRDDAPVELNARYLDALALLVREQGKLVTKDRFLQEVWRGVPVTDEALTQCIRTLRKQLGDNASSPSFIETVPKHGYRFIAAIETLHDDARDGSSAAEPLPPATPTSSHTAPDSGTSWRRVVALGGAGMGGGAAAGTIGGLLYGFAAAGQPLPAGAGSASVLLVVLSLTILVALLGSAGVAFGIAAGGFAGRGASPWSIVGGAAGGLAVGALVKLLGTDAFNLLFGQSPGDITGALEGALLGGAVGLGAWLASRGGDGAYLRRSVAAAAATGAAAGLLIALLGGRLLGGSLDLLATRFPESRLRLDALGELFGETGLGTISQVVTAGLEGALFGGCVVGAMIAARRSLGGWR